MTTARIRSITISVVLLLIVFSYAVFSFYTHKQKGEETPPESGALLGNPLPSIEQFEYNSFIKSALDGKCVSLPGATRQNDAHIISGDCWEHTKGRIWFDQVADGYTYQLRFQYSGKCLEPEGGENNAKVVQRVCHRGDFERPQISEENQLWNIVDQGNGKFSIVHFNSGLAMTALTGNDGENSFYLRSSNQSNSQNFSYLNKVTHESSPSEMGMWGNLIAWPFVPVHAAALFDDTFLTWASNEKESFTNLSSKSTWSSVFDAATGTFLTSNNPTHDMFCAGTVLLENGSVFVSGGNPQAEQSSGFDPLSKTWSPLSPMRQQRWYGTNVLTGDGDVLSTFAKGAQEIPELYSNENNSWQDLPGADMSDMRDEQDMHNALAVGYSPDLSWYAFMHTAPDGRIFNSGPLSTLHWFDTDGTGSSEVAGTPPGNAIARQYGSAAMYDVGKILVSGGSDPRVTGPIDNGDSGQILSATDTAFTVDINAATPTIEAIGSMVSRRSNHNSVVLPTGEVLVIGGSKTGIQFNDTATAWWSEIWNPQSQLWRSVAPISTPRGYHSWALLMRDGSVLSGGGGLCDTCPANHPDAQIFYPPYLFSNNGQASNRPKIMSATSTAQVGSTIMVSVDRSINHLNLVRLSSTTHSINTDQRFIPLTFEQNSNTQYVSTLSSNTHVLTPGMYWIFAVDAQGVPSEGHVLHVEALDEMAEPLLEMATNDDTLELQKNVDINIPLTPTGFDASSLNASAIDLPAGLSLDLQTHSLVGQAKDEGDGSFVLSVSDDSKQLTQRIYYTINPSFKTGAIGGGNSVSGGSVGLWFLLLLAASCIGQRVRATKLQA